MASRPTPPPLERPTSPAPPRADDAMRSVSIGRARTPRRAPAVEEIPPPRDPRDPRREPD
ncbi:hypothetical protein DB32_006852 [Sandaracinus amylolyticus]|uniref:Uncharacterized protein n=1 Tax=Sandaracinus amylolyticus TaxID=927083 RepID=A0A0F6YKY2_9BACT|nr:hypothetical protein DB32_006852 [Sandaracinus amylolyticus]